MTSDGLIGLYEIAFGSVAQWLKRLLYNPMVMGSNPALGTPWKKCLKTSFSGQPMSCEGKWAVSLGT